jgi:hypothetical protein
MIRRALICATAAILVFGFASVAGSQSDQSAPDPGSAKQPTKKAQSQQHRQQQPSAQHRQQQPAVQNRQQRPAAQNRQQQPAVQNRQQQPPALNRQQRPTTQRLQSQAPARNPQQRSVAPVQNRYTPQTRQVIPTPTQQRTGTARVEQRTVWPRYRAQSWSSQHRTWAQRGGYNGYRIPGPQFSLYFGRPHRFHLSTFQVRIAGAYPQFYADGYWFTMLDPVPEYWGNDWYDTDNVTVIESQDGYYLLDEAYPDAQLAISVQIP